MSEFIHFEEEEGIRCSVQMKPGTKYIPLTHIAAISEDSPLILPGHPNWEFDKLGPELTEWLEGKPHGISYRGKSVLIKLTKKDMALFRLFFG